MTKKAYEKPTVARFTIRSEDAVIAACKMEGAVQLPICEAGSGTPFAKEAGS